MIETITVCEKCGRVYDLSEGECTKCGSKKEGE
jgi:uncharacterized OB-fold protein